MTYLTAVLLIGVGAGLTAGIYYMSGFSKLKHLADEVQWEIMPNRQLVYNQDDAFTAVWEIRGPNLKYETGARADALADSVARAIDSLDERSMLHFNSIRQPARSYEAPAGSVPEVVALADREKRLSYESGNHFEDRTYIALTIAAPSEVMGRLRNLLYTGGDVGAVSWEKRIEEAEQRAQDFASYLPEDLEVRRVEGKELVSHLSQCLTGENEEINAPEELLPSLHYLFADRLTTGFEPKVGGRFMRVVSLQGFPEEVSMGVVRPLRSLPFPFRYSVRLICADQRAALSLMDRRKGGWTMQIGDLLSQIVGDGGGSELQEDTFAKQQVEEVEAAKAKLKSGATKLVNFTAGVIVWGDTKEEVNRRALSVEKALRGSTGLVVRRERELATKALLGSLPAHGYHNVRRFPMLTEAAVRFLPLTSIYAGPEKNPCSFFESEEGKAPPLFFASTRECVPYRFTPYVGDVGHQMVLGPTGGGKSILFGYQALRHLHYRNSQVVLLDRGYSFAPLCEAVGGTHYDINQQVGFQPLSHIDDPTELRWALSWVLSLCSMQGVTVGPTMRSHVEEQLRTMAGAHKDPEYRTLQELQTQLQIPELKNALDPFAGEGEVGMLLNAAEDSLTKDRFQVFELGPILELEPSIYTPILLYFFHRIETLLHKDRPTFVGADEFYMFAAQSEVGREYVMEALRTYRKKNAAMAIASQDPTDVTGDGMAAVLNSCRTKVLIPNPDAWGSLQREGYRGVGLNDREIQAVAESEPKREYLFKQPAGMRRADLSLGVELPFLEAREGHDLLSTAELMRRYKEELGPAWVSRWLQDSSYDPDQLARLGVEVHGKDSAAGAPAGDGSIARVSVSG